MNIMYQRALWTGAVIAALSLSAPAAGETLFKIVTVKDEIIVGLNAQEMAQYGADAPALAKSIVSKGTLPLWQYSVKKGGNGKLQQAPLHQIGVMSNYSLRVEPYKSPLEVLPHP